MYPTKDSYWKSNNYVYLLGDQIDIDRCSSTKKVQIYAVFFLNFKL